MSKLNVLLVAAVLCVGVHATIWQSCGTPSDHIKVSNVVMFPDPPVRGEACNVTLWGELDEQVTSGTYSMSIDYMNVPVYSQNGNVCTLTEGGCPSGPGSIEGSLIVPASAIPVFAPPGTYAGTAKLIDQTSAELACIQISFTLS